MSVNALSGKPDEMLQGNLQCTEAFHSSVWQIAGLFLGVAKTELLFGHYVVVWALFCAFLMFCMSFGDHTIRNTKHYQIMCRLLHAMDARKKLWLGMD